MAFVNSFLSYLLLMLIILGVGAVALTIGITMMKKKNASAALTEEQANE